MIRFLCWVAIVSLVAAFVLALAKKWGWIEWLQVHAPTKFLYRLFSCPFCCSFHAAAVLSVAAALVTGDWRLLLAPLCSTMITVRLW